MSGAASDAEIERFFAVCPDPLCVLDPRGRFLLSSRAWERTLGHDLEDLQTRSLLDLVHPEDADATRAQLARLAAGPASLGLENRCRSRSGRWVWLSWSLLSVPGEERIYAWARNIGKQKRLERALMQRIETKMLVTSISSHFLDARLEELDRGFGAALAELGGMLGADRASLFLLSEDGASFLNTHEWRAEGVPSLLEERAVVSKERFPWLFERLLRLELCEVPRVADLPAEASHERRAFEAQGVKSLVRVPAAYAGRLVGVVGVDAVRAHKKWDKGVRSLLQVLGEMFAISLERKRAEGSLREVIAQQEAMREVIDAQREAIQSLSTPIIQVWDGVLVLPLVGNIDNRRAFEITDKLLHAIVDTKSRHAIVELTGVETVDTATAQHLLGMLRTIELLGAQGVVAGIQPEVARTVSSLGLGMSSVEVRRDLQDALRWCIRQIRDERSRRAKGRARARRA